MARASRRLHRVVVASALLAVLVSGCAGGESGNAGGADTSTSVPSADLPAGDDATVTRVVDGDTIVVDIASRRVTVRLIGIDTPETKDPRKSVQCFGREASARTTKLLPAATKVRVVYDVERNDRYGRTLGYIYRIDDGAFVNAGLVRDGYASVYTYPPNVAHADEFVMLQRGARDAARGLWGACPLDPTLPAAPGDGAARCDPAYPDGCIPPSPPDLDCGDISARGFRVLAPDPHHFDSNGDGVGCEGL